MTASLQPPSGWQAAHVGTARDGFQLDGLDIWALPWRPEAGRTVRLSHPAHPTEIRLFSIYAIDDGKRAARFAAAELSAGVWGFYRWVVPADAAEGRSADGRLRYTHDHDGRDRVAPVARLFDAGGTLLFDGSAWFSSRVVPQDDGGLILALEQNLRQTLFRIEPGARLFREIGTSGPGRPLSGLADAAAAAMQDAIDPRHAYVGRRVAPDGSVIVELAAVEWANTQWVQSPRVTETATGRVLLDLWGSDWDAAPDFPRPGGVRLALRAWRSRAAGVVEIDATRGLAWLDGRDAPVPVADLPALIASLPPAPAASAPSMATPRVTARSWAVAAAILAGALLAIAAGTWLTLRLSPEPPPRLDRVPAMPSAVPRR